MRQNVTRIDFSGPNEIQNVQGLDLGVYLEYQEDKCLTLVSKQEGVHETN
jgi:hypothetical protein